MTSQQICWRSCGPWLCFVVARPVKVCWGKVLVLLMKKKMRHSDVVFVEADRESSCVEKGADACRGR